MTCIKTGCNIAFADSPGNVYRGDAHYLWKDTVVFKVGNPSFIPNAKIDFMIAVEVPVIELTDVIATRTCNVTVNNEDMAKMWRRCYDDSLLTIWSNEL